VNFQDIERSKLRAIVADIQGQVSAISTQFPAAQQAAVAARFAVSWAALVELLALGPEPDMRKCPFCDSSIQKAATRCMHCWKESHAPAEPASSG
jgi:hypothetical protein